MYVLWLVLKCQQMKYNLWKVILKRWETYSKMIDNYITSKHIIFKPRLRELKGFWLQDSCMFIMLPHVMYYYVSDKPHAHSK